MKKILLIIFILLILFNSCKKKEPLQESESTNSNQLNESQAETSQETQEAEPYVSQNDIEDNVSRVSNPKVSSPYSEGDDSIYDNSETLEFCLNDNEGRSFCLYHCISKIKDFSIEESTLGENCENLNMFSWFNLEKNSIKIIWIYDNAFIVRLETESPLYSTKRGVKVGDSLTDAFEKYAPDSIVKEFAPEEKKFVVTSHPENSTFITLYNPEEGMSVNAANMIDEEMMCIIFYAENGIISKISMHCGEWE